MLAPRSESKTDFLDLLRVWRKTLDRAGEGYLTYPSRVPSNRRVSELLNEPDVLELRSLHFNATQALKALIRQAESGGDLPDTLREMLLKNCGIKSTPKEKKQKRLSTVSAVDNFPAKDAI